MTHVLCLILHVVFALADCRDGHSAGALDGINASCESENDGVLLQKLRVKDMNARSDVMTVMADTEASSAKSFARRESLEPSGSSVKTSESADTFLQVSQRHSGHGSARVHSVHSGHSGHAKHGTVHTAHSLKAHLVHHDQEPQPHHNHGKHHERRHATSQSSFDMFDSLDSGSFEERLGHLSPQSLLRLGEEPNFDHGRRPNLRDAQGRVPGQPLPNVLFNDHRHIGLPQWFEKKKATVRNLMFEKCPEKKRPKVSAVAISNTTNQSSIKVQCNSGQLVGYWEGSEFISRCCEEDYCVGCAVLNTTNGTCEQCMAGYVRKEIDNRTECIICDDDRAWQDENGKTCWDFENQGLCSNGIPPGDNTPFQSLRRDSQSKEQCRDVSFSRKVHLYFFTPSKHIYIYIYSILFH